MLLVFILFYVIPELFEIVSCLRRYKKVHHASEWRGFLFDSYAGFRVAYRFLFVDWTRGSLLMAEYKYPLFLHAICVSTISCSGRRGRGVRRRRGPRVPDPRSDSMALPEKTVFFLFFFFAFGLVYDFKMGKRENLGCGLALRFSSYSSFFLLCLSFISSLSLSVYLLFFACLL